LDDSDFGFVGNQEKGDLGKMKTGGCMFVVSADGVFLLVN
jgi:hypothetical protein